MKSASTGGERSKKHVLLLSRPKQQHVRQRPEAALEPLARAARFSLLRRDGAADVGVLRPRDFPRRGAAGYRIRVHEGAVLCGNRPVSPVASMTCVSRCSLMLRCTIDVMVRSAALLMSRNLLSACLRRSTASSTNPG